MIDEDHRALRESVGMYVLGRLDEPETLRVRAHLDGCRECRLAAADLAPVATALASVEVDALGQPPAPPPGLGDAILARIAEERREGRGSPSSTSRPGRARSGRGSSLSSWLLAAAIMVALLGGFAVGWTVKPAPSPPATVSVELQRRPDVTALAQAQLVDAPTGIEIALTVTGLSDGTPYRVEVIDSDANRFGAGGLIGRPREQQVRLTAPVPMGRTVAFEVLDPDGRRVLWSTWG